MYEWQGIDYRLKRLDLDDMVIKLQIWDTAGQERFRAITQNFYKGAMGKFEIQT